MDTSNVVITAKAKKVHNLPPEGTYTATLTSITYKPDANSPKKVVLHLALDGRTETVDKEMEFLIDDDSTLRRDAEALLGRQITNAEAEAGFKLAELMNKQANVMVAHGSGPGGRLKLIATRILPHKVG